MGQRDSLLVPIFTRGPDPLPPFSPDEDRTLTVPSNDPLYVPSFSYVRRVFSARSSGRLARLRTKDTSCPVLLGLSELMCESQYPNDIKSKLAVL